MLGVQLGYHAGPASLAQYTGRIKLLIAALAVRLLLVPLSHTWDGQTWQNTFAQLAGPGGFLDAVRRPYEVVREQTLLTNASTPHGDFYEGWAYPPLMLYIYYPLAKLYAALGGSLQATYPVQPAFFVSTVPLPLLALIKLPNLLADAASLGLLAKLGTGLQELRWYAFNPLVLLVGAWTFDPVMVALLLAAVLLAERRRWAWAGVAIACGGAAKLVPLLALPAMALAILAENAPVRDRALALGRLLGATALALALLLWPVWDGVRQTLAYQTSRFAIGLTAQQLWRTWAQQLPNTDWEPRWQLYASGLLGNLLLPLLLLAACWLLCRRQLPVRTGTLILVLAFLAGSKVVNEPYALAPVALLTAVLAARPDERLRACRGLLWIVAFGYAVIQIPIWSLGFSMARQLAPAIGPALTRWAVAYRVFINEPQAAWPYALLGTAFTVLTLATLWCAWRASSAGSARGSVRLAGGGPA